MYEWHIGDIMTAHYNGKNFDTIQEMIEYANRHTSTAVTLPDLELMTKQMAQTIWMNLSMYDIQLTNGQMRTYLERHMITLISVFINRHKKESV